MALKNVMAKFGKLITIKMISQLTGLSESYLERLKNGVIEEEETKKVVKLIKIINKGQRNTSVFSSIWQENSYPDKIASRLSGIYSALVPIFNPVYAKVSFISGSYSYSLLEINRINCIGIISVAINAAAGKHNFRTDR